MSKTPIAIDYQQEQQQFFEYSRDINRCLSSDSRCNVSDTSRNFPNIEINSSRFFPNIATRRWHLNRPFESIIQSFGIGITRNDIAGNVHDQHQQYAVGGSTGGGQSTRRSVASCSSRSLSRSSSRTVGRRNSSNFGSRDRNHAARIDDLSDEENGSQVNFERKGTRRNYENIRGDSIAGGGGGCGGTGDACGGDADTELLPKDARTFSSILNAGEHDEVTISGYEKSLIRSICCWICILLTGGLLRLILHWWQHWLLYATYRPCPLDLAEKILIQENYNEKHTTFYIKDVIIINVETISELHRNRRKWEAYFARDKEEDKLFQNFYLSAHTQSGHFRHMDSVRMFRCKQLRYIWDEQKRSFQKLKGLDHDVPVRYLHQRKGLSYNEEYARRLIYGPNEITVPFKTIPTLLFLEILNPFYVFQVFSVALWISYNYYYYAVVIVIMTVFGITMSVMQTRKNQNALRETVMHSDYALVLHDDGYVEKMQTHFLVPGDLIEIPANGCTMHCDAVLLSGNCILDEAILTGESVPVTKTPLPYKHGLLFDVKEHSRHILFCGTKVIQTRYIGTEKVLAIVINTGNITAKGGLIRSILYPPPVDYKFEKDSYKFITLLALIAAVGFLYTLITKILRGISASKIAIESLDLITIAVPPALPAAMSVGRFNALKRLKQQNIYCIAPRSINIAGSIDCVCFDKTGTLTEDGLDMWGVLPKSHTNQFQMPLKDITRLPYEHFLYGMVSCHSITIMNGELKGDPLDLKMFESTGWILEEANIAENNKYDLLFPTILKPPRLGKGDSDRSLNLTDSVEDIPISNDIGVVREFPFTSSLQRMSVITRRIGDKHFNVYCKGSPEMIQTLCRPESVPDDYSTYLNNYAQQGYRIIAVACKSLNRKINFTKAHRMARDQIESELEFLGFVILENRLKPDTTKVIQNLIAANIRTVMVTGDNILTAISVAKDCGMVSQQQSIITVNARASPTKSDEYEIYYNLSPGNVGGVADVRTNGGANGDVNSLLTPSNSITNSISSLETVDTWTHRDVELGITGKDNLPDGRFDYRFALVGKTWAVLTEYFPELIPRIVTKGTIFARMSPDQKQALILEYQNLGYYVAMCGDGANDCGALKAAHTGISLSEAESSVASPFTSRNPTIACVPTVVKEGRSALVTSFGIFKYMAAYSLVQFISVLLLYSIDSNLTDIQFLYIDLFMISVFAFFFGRTGAYDGTLVKETPLNSLVSISPIASLLLQILVALIFQTAAWFHVQQQDWFTPFNFSAADNEENVACYENYTIFAVSAFQYIILAFVFSKGKPYRKSITSNYWLVSTIIINLAVVVYVTIIPPEFLANFMELILPPGDYWFRAQLVFYGVLNFIVALIVEEFVVDYFLFRKLRYRFRNLKKSSKRYLLIESDLRNDQNWPSLSTYAETGAIRPPDDSSPVSYAEIGAVERTAAELLEAERESSVLNRFFDPKLQNDVGDEKALSVIASDSETEYCDAESQPTLEPNGLLQPDNGPENPVILNSCDNLQSRNDSGIDFEITLGSMATTNSTTPITSNDPSSTSSVASSMSSSSAASSSIKSTNVVFPMSAFSTPAGSPVAILTIPENQSSQLPLKTLNLNIDGSTSRGRSNPGHSADNDRTNKNMITINQNSNNVKFIENQLATTTLSKTS